MVQTRCEFPALEEISSTQSDLYRRGKDITKRISFLTKKPVYYYLYRVGGVDKASELERKCPSCNSDWKLDEPWFGLFDFRCEPCGLVSNVSWDFQ